MWSVGMSPQDDDYTCGVHMSRCFDAIMGFIYCFQKNENPFTGEDFRKKLQESKHLCTNPIEWYQTKHEIIDFVLNVIFLLSLLYKFHTYEFKIESHLLQSYEKNTLIEWVESTLLDDYPKSDEIYVDKNKKYSIQLGSTPKFTNKSVTI